MSQLPHAGCHGFREAARGRGQLTPIIGAGRHDLHRLPPGHCAHHASGQLSRLRICMHSLITYVTTFAPQTWALGTYVVATFAIVALMLGLSWVLRGRNHGRAKVEPFESGVVPTGGARLRISAKFYLVAMFFVIFDVEEIPITRQVLRQRQFNEMPHESTARRAAARGAGV